MSPCRPAVVYVRTVSSIVRESPAGDLARTFPAAGSRAPCRRERYPRPEHLPGRRPDRQVAHLQGQREAAIVAIRAWRWHVSGLSGCSSVEASTVVPANPRSRNGVNPPVCGCGRAAPAAASGPAPARRSPRALRRRSHILPGWPWRPPPRAEFLPRPESGVSTPLHSTRYAPTTARSVMSSALSMIANASRSSASVTHSGGLVKNVCQRTKV